MIYKINGDFFKVVEDKGYFQLEAAVSMGFTVYSLGRNSSSVSLKSFLWL